MRLAAGTILQSTPLLEGSFFENTSILIVASDQDGATGFVFNKPSGRSLNGLEEFSSSPYFPLYDGGPVDQEHLYFIHKRPDIVSGGTPVAGEVYLAGDFAEVVAAINSGDLPQEQIRIFIGYCGWDAGELEAEIAEGSWQVLENIGIGPVFSQP